MATGGFGVSSKKSGAGRRADFSPKPGVFKLADGKALEGTLLNQSDSAADLLTADGKIHLLSREGDVYR